MYNWIHHNEVSNCTYGLRIINNSNYTYIEDNNFHHNIKAGIQADLHALNHLSILRNTIRYNQDGIKLYDVSHANVKANNISDNTGYGLFTNTGTTQYTIVENIIKNNGTNISLGSAHGTYQESSPTSTPAASATVTPTVFLSPTVIPTPGCIDTGLCITIKPTGSIVPSTTPTSIPENTGFPGDGGNSFDWIRQFIKEKALDKFQLNKTGKL
jgi:parallel beta-helix repeat protein